MVDLTDPDWWAGRTPSEAAATLAELRRTDPVHAQPDDGGGRCWAVLRHADVVHVARHPELFSASLGGVVVEDLDEATLAGMRKMLLAMDPPGHAAHRQPLAPHFGARVVGGIEARIRTICRAVLEEVPDGERIDHVHQVCASLPSLVIADLFGLPGDDVGRIQRWAERSTSTHDEEVAGSADDVATAMIEMVVYFMELGARRRSEPRRDDLTSVILESTVDGEVMDDEAFGSFMVQLVTAGNDTTRTMLSSGTLLLVEHPDQQRLLRDDPAVIPSAVEEVLRFANPLHYFRRTATSDTEIGGTAVGAGDKVLMSYTSANRDEAVFAESDRFDVTRHPNPHLSFGIGPHFCLGAHLARLEGKVFFEELLGEFRSIEAAGEPVRVRSNLNNGYKQMPMVLSR